MSRRDIRRFILYTIKKCTRKHKNIKLCANKNNLVFYSFMKKSIQYSMVRIVFMTMVFNINSIQYSMVFIIQFNIVLWSHQFYSIFDTWYSIVLWNFRYLELNSMVRKIIIFYNPLHYYFTRIKESKVTLFRNIFYFRWWQKQLFIYLYTCTYQLFHLQVFFGVL